MHRSRCRLFMHMHASGIIQCTSSIQVVSPGGLRRGGLPCALHFATSLENNNKLIFIQLPLTLHLLWWYSIFCSQYQLWKIIVHVRTCILTWYWSWIVGIKYFLRNVKKISRFSRHLPGGLGHYCIVLAKIVPCTCPPHAHHTPNLVTLPNNKLSVCVCGIFVVLMVDIER